MKKIRLAVIGGFLGAGKTTVILNLAKRLIEQGKTVGIVTNDQGSDLVDTSFLKSAGFPVLEVAGGCFCCNFNEFTEKVNSLARTALPDIILAEPVGSCTDLIATIFRPFQLKRAGEFSLSPLCVIIDPKRVWRLMMDGNMNFQNEINYLFTKQVEEADIIAVNKIDMYSDTEIEEIEAFLRERFKGTVITRISAKNDDNLSSILPLILGGEIQDKPLMELDYDTYGLAESFLGWFNGTATVMSPSDIDFKQFAADFMLTISLAVADLKKEIAHLKVYMIASGGYLKASITSVDEKPDFSGDIKVSKSASLVINARINAEPEVIEPVIYKAFEDAVRKHHLSFEEYKADCFKPGRPDPSARERANEHETVCKSE